MKVSEYIINMYSAAPTIVKIIVVVLFAVFSLSYALEKLLYDQSAGTNRASLGFVVFVIVMVIFIQNVLSYNIKLF